MNSDMDSRELVPVGKVLKVHGIKGKVKVAPLGETLEQLQRGRIVYVRDPDREWRSLVVENVQRQPRFLIMSFKGIWQRDHAEFLRGKEIYFPASQLPELEEGEYYHYQLVGLEVVDLKGGSLGKLAEIIETGSNDVYVVKTAEKEILIPAIESVVKDIDLYKKTMTVDLPEGLTE